MSKIDVEIDDPTNHSDGYRFYTKPNGKLEFVGNSSDNVAVGGSPRLEQGESLTITMSVDVMGSADSPIAPGIVGAASSGNWNNWLSLRRPAGESSEATGSVESYITLDDVNGNQESIGPFTVETGKQLALAIVIHADGTATFYVDGQSVGTSSIAFDYLTLGYLAIGYAGATDEGSLDGRFEEFRHHNVELSSTQAQTHADGGELDTDGKFRYLFANGSGSTVDDALRKGRDGTINGSPTWLEGGSWTQQADLGASAENNGTVTHTISGLNQNTDYLVRGEIYTEHTSSYIVHGRVAKTMSRSPSVTGDSQIDTARTMSKARSATSQADGQMSVTRSTSKSRSSANTADGSMESTRSGTTKPRNPINYGDGQMVSDAQFMEAFPSELTRDLNWDYNTDRRGFESEWVHRESANGQDTVSFYIDGKFGMKDPASPTVIIDFDKTGDGNVDERSKPKSIYAAHEPVVFPSLSGDSGYYRVLLKDLRPSDIMTVVMFGPSHT